MSTMMVALDLETTGLDPKVDQIIEIGAVRFTEDGIDDEFQTLINPGRAISHHVTQLTSITNAMVHDAPKITDKLEELKSFVGSCPIVGHNIGFDISFLTKFNVLQNNPRVDTMHLASFVLPSVARYSLGSLVTSLEAKTLANHRALDDAKSTYAIYSKMVELLKDIPISVIDQLLKYSQNIDWGAKLPLERFVHQNLSDKHSLEQLYNFDGFFAEGESLNPKDDIEPLNVNYLEHLFSKKGSLSETLHNFEYRIEQVEMVKNISEALSHPRHLLIEAGTGTGKSLAYLIPAIQWAYQNGQRVLVSTNTINLQDQLIKKDIPVIRQVLDCSFQAVQLKGRSNYICPRRFDVFRKKGPRNITEMNVLAKLLNWLTVSATGDRSEITLSGLGENAVWMQVSAEDDGCTQGRCATEISGGCPIYRARRAAESAHLIVVNHALLLADVASESRILPEYNYLIVDEAHHFEDATTMGLSFVARQKDFERLLKSVGSVNNGMLKHAKKYIVDKFQDDSTIKKAIDEIASSIGAVLIHSESFFQALSIFVMNQDQNNYGEYDKKLLIVKKSRESQEWSDVLVSWDNLHNTLIAAIKRLKSIQDKLHDPLDQKENLQSEFVSIVGKLIDFDTNVSSLVYDDHGDNICWIQMSRDKQSLDLRSAPLNVGPLVQQYLWYEKQSVVMTSATLTTNKGNFDYIKERLYAEDADEIVIGSPFDYKQSTLLCIPTDIPEPPNRASYQKFLEKGIIDLCSAINGRTLVLFTSHSQLRLTAHAIRSDLESIGITVYDQSGSASRHQLLSSFRTADKAVLLGTQSFWEGVDVLGPDLSAVIIARLPFDVPSDPIIQARSLAVEKQGWINSFVDYLVPKAIIRFRQGFGRLIRSQKDRGLVIVFDRRIDTKSYGKFFLDSLPDCTYWRGNLSDLPRHAVSWINTKT